jgi:hypothetical protein
VSDVMLFGVLQMPYDMAMADELSRRQYYDRAQQALGMIEAMRAELVAALRESEEWRRDAESGEEWLSTFIDGAGVEHVPREHANLRLASLQARIDALMLEYCPDEMADEQRAEWARHQVPAIDAARKEGA